MLILPERYQPRVLIPVPERQWREPSEAQPKDQFGNQNCTRFRLTARLNDGFVRWRGWFDSRDDADAFLYALALNIIDGTPIPIEMWRLPSPGWHPDIGEGVSYDFATLVTLTASPGSNQTYTSAVDWWNSNNTIEVLGAGGSGGLASGGNPQSMSGGGGGEYRKISNFSFAAPGTTTATYQIGSGHSTGAGSGTAGGDTWFNATTFGASSVGGHGGGAGIQGTSSASAAAGGSGGIGTTGNNGGGSGSVTGTITACGTGGGGAGGPNGVGNTSASLNTSAGATSGGSGDAGSGGSGGAGSTSGVATAGGNGTEWDGSHGSGGGGGGTGQAGTNAAAGGNYGGGGGGGQSASGAGIQGIVVLTYTPFKRGAFLAFF